MRKMNLKLILLLMLAVPVLLITSCGTDDPKPDTGDSFLPVKGENFDVTVSGNDVVFTTTINGNVWVTTNGVDYTFADKTVTVNLPNQGTYSFTCSSLGSGAVLTSAAFDVVIEQDDLGFLDEGLWKFLSGGANQTKTWRMDINPDAKCVYFEGPLYYSGYEKDGVRYPYWAWDVTQEVSSDTPYILELEGGGTAEITGLTNWEPDYAGNTWLMAAKDYGSITFDATNGTVSTSIFGANASGTFSFNDETMKLNLSGVTIPIDTGRLNEGQFKDEDLLALRIFSLKDSSMQIGVKRSFEGFEDDGVTHKVSEWTQIYNFVVVGYTYPEKVVLVPENPINTAFTQADLEGTWKYAPVPYDWIGWENLNALNNWATVADLLAAGWAAGQADLDAAADDTFVFNSDGTCTLNGVANTYTVADGVITLGTDLTTELAVGWFTLVGTHLEVVDVQVAAVEGGIWIGYQNEAKYESQAFHLVKQ